MIESIVNEIETVVKDYPKLMIHYNVDVIVLFTAPKIGTVVYSKDSINKVGYTSDIWNDEEYWKPFHGTVTLYNK